MKSLVKKEQFLIVPKSSPLIFDIVLKICLK